MLCYDVDSIRINKQNTLLLLKLDFAPKKSKRKTVGKTLAEMASLSLYKPSEIKHR